MSTSAFVGATATAGAAEKSHPTSPDCQDPAAASPSAIPAWVMSGTGCDLGKIMARNVLAETMDSDARLQAAAPAVMQVFDLLNPRLGECDTPPAPSAGDTAPANAVESNGSIESIQSIAEVTGSDLTAVVGAPIVDALLIEVAAPEPALTVNTVADSAAADAAASRSANAGVATAVGGVVIEETVVEERAGAPRQAEVVGPQTAATGGLPDTGFDGSVLTMLGLAMIASGAAARCVARD